ncbi:MAG: hypothetical protein JXR42_04890 [Gammaproteobacteria bacterium]|nr:hypothetical protein [Gammaproteobacteria bacterium]
MSRERLICANQDCIVRYDPAVNSGIDFTGLATDDLQSCLAVIVCGENGRISLTHKSRQLPFTEILKEIDWVSRGDQGSYQLFVIRQVDNVMLSDHERELISTHFSMLGKALLVEKGISFITQENATHSIAVNLSGEIFEPTDDSFLRAPNVDLFKVVNDINRIVCDPAVNMPGLLQFDGSKWSEEVSVAADVNKIVSTIGIV